ncbi:MAG: cytochrome P450 [Thermoanaerobaculia bacterium]|nr:cytochrome P450 [Thermoanaerobaculia bacterium]
MAKAVLEVDFVGEVRERRAKEGGVFRTSDGELAVFDPQAAQRINALNFADLTLPDKLLDVVRGKPGDPVSWKLVRSALSSRLADLSAGPALESLAGRMAALLDERLGENVDLVWLAQQVITRSLLPIVIDGLGPKDHAKILRDQDFKLARLVRTRREPESRFAELWSIYIQVSAGSVVRRELRGRRKGRRPRRHDLTDPIVDLLPQLGLDRAVDAVTTVLTAIAGPPGASAASLLYELLSRPDWAVRLSEELAPLSLAEIAADPLRRAPTAHRFVKEVLRMWSPPVFMTRPVRCPIDHGGHHLEPGDRYLLSPYFIHHDPALWPDHDTFDPDRWLPGAPNGRATPASYVPFGWAPKSCLGAALGTAQLILFTALALKRYRFEVEKLEEVPMMLAAVPLPVGMRGRVASCKT